MSGGISFPNDRYWGKAGWVYRAVLSSLCDVLRNNGDESGLLQDLSDETGSAVTIEFIDAEEWPNSKVLVLCNAIGLGYKLCEKIGPKDWNDPSFFPAFMKCYSELVTLAQEVKGDISS